MILVTGATGHIGNVLVRKLLEQGKKVRALIWRGEDTSPLRGLDVESVEGDVLDPESLKAAFRGVDEVYHLAGIISIMPGQNPFVWRVNVEGTRNVLEAARRNNIRRLIYTSSIHALRRAPHGKVIDESLPFDPNNPYGAYDRSKAEASLEVQKTAREGLEAVIVCPTGVIGINYSSPNYQGSSLVWVVNNTVGCNTGYSYVSPTMPSGWNDVVSSARTYGGCNNNPHYEHTYYSGAVLNCTCATMGVMDNATSSEKWYR